MLKARGERWCLVQERLTGLDAWPRSVAANPGDINYEERRLALRALGDEARVWHFDHDPRFDITMRLDLIDSTRRGCSHKLPSHVVLRWTDRHVIEAVEQDGQT
jgi:hypothetical protein